MRKHTILFILMLLISSVATQQVLAQGNFLKKLKKKAEDEAIEQVFGKDEQPEGNQSSNPNSPTNTSGSGLTTTPPDVMENIGEAEDAFGDKQYADARFAVRQAILGIELEIGNNILEGFPKSIDGLPAIEDEDMVASSGIGFVGLVIERTYREGDKQFKVTVGNESALFAAAGMYLAAGGGYTNTQDQDHKTVKLGEHRGVIEFDESNGYKLTVPFGQSSVMMTEGINFNNEEEMMSASEKIDLDNIKKELGEE